MNYLEFRNKNSVPPGGWQYEDDQTGTRYGYRDAAPGRMRFDTLDNLCSAIIEDRSIRKVLSQGVAYGYAGVQNLVICRDAHGFKG